MKFCEYTDVLQMAKRLSHDRCDLTRQEVYDIIDNPLTNPLTAPMESHHVKWESDWFDSRRPYYDVYPSIIPMLTTLSIDVVTGDMIHPPAGLKALLIRLPETQRHLVEHQWQTRTIWVHFGPVRERGKDVPGVFIAVDYGEADPTGMPCTTMRGFPLDGRPISEALDALAIHDSINLGQKIPDKLLLDSVKLALMICLLSENAELVQPQLLNKDHWKEVTWALVDKAHRRGKVAFSVGKSLEVIPHYRRPHLAIQRYGKGRKQAKVIMRGFDKPIIVHREKIKEVPTGFLDKLEGKHVL